MMKQIKKIIGLSALALLLACQPVKKLAVFPDFTKENISGAALWQRITTESNYQQYPMWPAHSGLQLGMSPHGRYHKVFINEKLLAAVPNAARMAPNGALCLKENYSASNELLSITGMVKVADYNPQAGDWFWVMYAPNGKVGVEGKIAMCSNCHAGSNNDYITIWKLDKPFTGFTGKKE